MPDAPSTEGFVEQAREYSDLTPLVVQIRLLDRLGQEYAESDALLNDPDYRTIALEEIHRIQGDMDRVEQEIRYLLLPQDEDDCRNVIMEIRAGTGGEEAALFVGDLLRMYRRYGESKGWSMELLHCHESEQGGMKEVGLSLIGKNVFGRLKFEAGVHRVQRVPATEANGRLHTSTATVSVLPEAAEIDVYIEEKDLRIDVFRSSGPGGQSVNTTDSAVRVTHIPTGLVVQQQDEKSQHKNKAKALKILRSRLYDKLRQDQEKERSNSRQSQVGRGDRSERIRTYNFPQGRITDHRVKLTLYQLSQIMEGQGLDEIIDALISDFRAQQLACEIGN